MRILRKQFFEQPTLTVAKELLGKFLVRSYRGKTTSAMITEVEAYDGFEDLASHAHRGKTERNAPMFGEAGVWYIYLVYGLHWMLNIVTGRKNYPAAVLIRGVEDIPGPARVTKAFRVTKPQNGKPALPATGLWIEDRGIKVRPKDIKRAPRIGVAYAGAWAHKHFRFTINT